MANVAGPMAPGTRSPVYQTQGSQQMAQYQSMPSATSGQGQISYPQNYSAATAQQVYNAQQGYAAQGYGGQQAYSSQQRTSSAFQTGGGYQTTPTNYGMSGVTSGGHQTERVESTRQVSSTIVHEEYVGELPKQDGVTYVEVPYYEEVIKHVARKEVIEVEKRVPKYEYEWVERIVEVPQIQYVDRQVDVPQIQEVIRHVPKTQIIDVPMEVLRHVPRIENKIVEKLVEVPGQIIEVPKPYTVENKIPVTRYNDREVNMVVAQSVKPILVEGQGQIDVDVNEYEPECVPVDVHVIKPVSAPIVAGLVETLHKIVTVPAAQYNSMLKSLNVHLNESEVSKLPYLTEQGRIPFLSDQRMVGAQPLPGAIIHDQFGNLRQTTTVTAGRSSQLYTGSSAMNQSAMISGSQQYTSATSPMMMQTSSRGATGAFQSMGAVNGSAAFTTASYPQQVTEVSSATYKNWNSAAAPASYAVRA